jgi:predicted nucleic acid-binding protein
MSIVVDASVVIAALVDNGKAGRWSEALLVRDSLAAPELLLVECTNVLRRLELRSILSQSEACAAQEDLLLLNVQLLPFYPLADRVWELRHNLSSYDATYIATAEAIDAPLATLDLKMASQPTKCKFLTP